MLEVRKKEGNYDIQYRDEDDAQNVVNYVKEIQIS